MPFTPVHTLLGGYLLHLSTSSTLEDTGRVLGISGIVDGSVFGSAEGWQWATVSGLVAGPLLGHLIGLDKHYPSDGLAAIGHIGIGRLCLSGGLIGFGSKLGSGCTSGHMLCGVSRLAPRSIVATITFFTTAVITANLVPISAGHLGKPAYTVEGASSTTLATLVGTIVVCSLALNGLRRVLVERGPESGSFLRVIPYFAYGLTFSLGLLISGMADPVKVLGFLRFPEINNFDPSLAMVVLGGLVPNAIHYARLVKARANSQAPATRYPWEAWRVPRRTEIDWRLILGAAIFGVGWGLGGVCPGPALVGLGDGLTRLRFYSGGDGATASVTMIGSMLLGMGLGGLI